MNISTLLVFVSAVVSVYGYHHGLPCSDCNQPCSAHRLMNVAEQLRKHMDFSDCRQNDHISNTANPTWTCKPSHAVFNRIGTTVHNATCEKCSDSGFEAVSIVQNVSMLFKKRCLDTNDSILYVKPVTISLGCTCAKTHNLLNNTPH